MSISGVGIPKADITCRISRITQQVAMDPEDTDRVAQGIGAGKSLHWYAKTVATASAGSQVLIFQRFEDIIILVADPFQTGQGHRRFCTAKTWTNSNSRGLPYEPHDEPMGVSTARAL